MPANPEPSAIAQDPRIDALPQRDRDQASPKIAYFSMEIGLESSIPTYSGGLGVLAGDTLRSAADLGVQMVGVTLLYRKGYFLQSISVDGEQTEHPVEWSPADVLDRMQARTSVTIEGREVEVGCWRYRVQGVGGHVIPVYLLDTDLDSNAEGDRTFTHYLYGGDERYRLCQEAILGIGGQQILAQLGHGDTDVYHMNEGHSSLLGLSLLEKRLADRNAKRVTQKDLASVRQRCVFTTHTPVPAGHDRFHHALVEQVLSTKRTELLAAARILDGQTLNMTKLALECSHYVNGVARIHQLVSQDMFPKYRIRAVTNGVHSVTWAAPPMRDLFDRHIPEWRSDNVYLRYASDIPLDELATAHRRCKRALLNTVRDQAGAALDEEVFTICFARRATPYKRCHLLFQNLDRLKWIAANVGPFQLIFGGKAHPRDEGGKNMIRLIHDAARQLDGAIRIVYVENYEMDQGRLLTSGADVWLNTPEKTREASGTSGMKAALNGVPSLSVLDGWWIEGHVEGVTGWSAANYKGALDDEATVAHALYDKLERVVIPLFYQNPNAYAQVMRSAISLNGAFFNTQRMVAQYVFNAYSRRDRYRSASISQSL